jgi:hypothetical protein
MNKGKLWVYKQQQGCPQKAFIKENNQYVKIGVVVRIITFVVKEKKSIWVL